MAIVITEKDAENLREMWAWYKSQRVSTPRGSSVTHLPQTPEVYVVKPQGAGGIPALDEDDDEPGSAACDVYKLDTSSPPALVAVSGLERTVYNLSEKVVEQDWLLAVRDKFGKWFALDYLLQVATMIKASVNEAGNVAAGDVTFNIDGVTIIQPNGVTKYPGGSAPTSVNNTWGVPSEDDDTVIAWYDFDSNDWHGLPHFYTTECP